jgi:hypothetical protein
MLKDQYYTDGNSIAIVVWGKIISNMTNNNDETDDQPSLDDLISLSEAAKISGLTQPHLALMIRRGKLWGKKIGRNWITTEQAVQEYLARDRKPGPKPRNAS